MTKQQDRVLGRILAVEEAQHVSGGGVGAPDPTSVGFAGKTNPSTDQSSETSGTNDTSPSQDSNPTQDSSPTQDTSPSQDSTGAQADTAPPPNIDVAPQNF